MVDEPHSKSEDGEGANDEQPRCRFEHQEQGQCNSPRVGRGLCEHKAKPDIRNHGNSEQISAEAAGRYVVPRPIDMGSVQSVDIVSAAVVLRCKSLRRKGLPLCLHTRLAVSGGREQFIGESRAMGGPLDYVGEEAIPILRRHQMIRVHVISHVHALGTVDCSYEQVDAAEIARACRCRSSRRRYVRRPEAAVQQQ